MTDLRKAIFYVQQSIRKSEENNEMLLKALDILCEVDLKNKKDGD
jgi:hypothetical protein